MSINDVAIAARVVVALILLAAGVGKLLVVRQLARTYREQRAWTPAVATAAAGALIGVAGFSALGGASGWPMIIAGGGVVACVSFALPALAYIATPAIKTPPVRTRMRFAPDDWPATALDVTWPCC